MRISTGTTLIAAVAFAGVASGQVQDQFIFYTSDGSIQKTVTLRINRKLEVLGSTVTHPIAGDRQACGVDPQGRYALGLAEDDVLWMNSQGGIDSSTPLQHDPHAVRVDRSGVAYVESWLGVFQPGPLYAVGPGGSVLWSNPLAMNIYVIPPEHIVITRDGQLWIASEVSGWSGGFLWTVVMRLIDTASGKVVRSLELPAFGFPNGDTFISKMAASPDGTIWVAMNGQVFAWTLVETDGISILKTLQPAGGSNGVTAQTRVDARGHLLVTSFPDQDGGYGGQLRRFSKVDGSLLDTYDLALDDSGQKSASVLIGSFALGPTGEEAFVYGVSALGPFVARLNLVTGVRSMVHGFNFAAAIPSGDPTGFILANVIDQDGDNDGDGFKNREETLAGSHPFDAGSTPNGPKVYLSFVKPGNAIRLRYIDPDGLLDPTGGIDPSTLSLVAEGVGEVLPALWPFVTSVSVSPDGTDATVEFGALPIPDGLKIRLEATVFDRSGAYGWDWQFTPPGYL